jgi:N-acyl-D-amino-acid deacylase
VVFDPARVQDRSSITAPARHPSGYVHVMVNGRPVLVDGVRNEEQPGRVLRAGH